MQKPLSTTAYALLGLLRLRPWGTYELAQQVKRSLHWFWPRAERQLYEEPKRLAERGLATATVEAVGNRPRTVYSITDAGRTALADWMSEPAEPRSMDFAGMIKIFLGDAGTLAQLEANLTRIETEARDRAATLTTLARESLASFPFPDRHHLGAATLRLHLDLEIAIVRWVQWMREQAAQWPSTTDSGDWSALGSLRESIALGEELQAT